MVTPQFVFMIIGIVSFAAALILFVVSIVYFTRNDIRGVMDDLSGKTRSQASAVRTQSRRGLSKQTRTARVFAPGQTSEGVPAREESGSFAQLLEDDIDTILDTKLRKIPSSYGGVSSDIQDVNDGIPTLVTSVGEYHREDMSEMNLGDADNPAVAEGAEENMPTQVEKGSVAYGSRFVVTKSILAIHSKEIIAVE